MKKQMKKVLCVVLSILMAFSYAVPAFAGSIDNTHLSTKHSDIESDTEVKAVEKKIDTIGKVHYTDKSLAKIIVAENAYNALSNTQKLSVSNYGALKSARNTYDALVADNIDTSSYTITDKGSLSDDVNWFVYDNGLLEIAGKGSIPSYSKGNAPWYQYKDTITSILVRSSITDIGDSSFYGCNNVTEITLPFVGASRDAIGYSCSFGYIFGYSTSSYTSSNSFDDDFAPGYGYKGPVYNGAYDNGYYYYRFSVPSSLKKVTVTDATQIGKGAFHKCTGISEIVLNDGITSIGDYAFYNNPWYNNLTDEFVTVGDNVLIKYNGTKSSVTIPDTVKHIAGGVFKDNNKISEVVLPNELLSIGDNAFKGTALSTVTIPRSIIKKSLISGKRIVSITCRDVYSRIIAFNSMIKCLTMKMHIVLEHTVIRQDIDKRTMLRLLIKSRCLVLDFVLAGLGSTIDIIYFLIFILRVHCANIIAKISGSL